MPECLIAFISCSPYFAVECRNLCRVSCDWTGEQSQRMIRFLGVDFGDVKCVKYSRMPNISR